MGVGVRVHGPPSDLLPSVTPSQDPSGSFESAFLGRPRSVFVDVRGGGPGMTDGPVLSLDGSTS